jgi:hypothetical protein
MRYLVAAQLLVARSFPADARQAERGTAPGQIYAFRYSPCKSAECYAKHLSGEWLHPLTVPYGSSGRRSQR